MALIQGGIAAQAQAATVVAEFVFPGWPPLVLDKLPAASSASLSDPYPLLDPVSVLDTVSADSVGNVGDGLGAENVVAISGKNRTDTLRGYTNALSRIMNLLTDRFLDRDGVRVGEEASDTTHMRGNLDVGGNRIVGLAAATDANDLVTYAQFKVVRFAYEDATDLSAATLLRRDGSVAMGAKLNLGIADPGRRVINLAAPSQPSHAVTDTYFDTVRQSFESSYLDVNGTLPMTNAGQAWDLDGNPARNGASPISDSHAATKVWFDEAVGNSVGQGGIPIGAVLPHFGTVVPAGFLLCDGREISRTTYQELFAVIGIAYGTPSGSSTFLIPDLRGRIPIGLDNMGGTFANVLDDYWSIVVGGTGGAQSVTLDISQLPGHTHTKTDRYFAGGSGGSLRGVAVPETDAATLYSTPNDTGSAGGGGSHGNLQPSIFINWIVRAS
tara:strand:+ start:2993 stop:4315 length:1323 start_codon:yes stop_codon:yes gene_type:complete